MEEQNQIIPLLRKIIDLQDEIRSYREESEIKMMEQFNKMVEKINRQNENIEGLLRTMRQEMTAAKLQAEKSEAKRNEDAVNMRQQMRANQMKLTMELAAIKREIRPFESIMDQINLDSYVSEVDLEEDVVERQPEQNAADVIPQQPQQHRNTTTTPKAQSSDNHQLPQDIENSWRSSCSMRSIAGDDLGLDKDDTQISEDAHAEQPASPVMKKPKMSVGWRQYVIRLHGTKMLQCQKCGQVYKGYSSIKYHIEGVHLEVVHPCQVASCGFSGRSLPSLINHTKSHHPEIRFDCSQCDYTTTIAASLANHTNKMHGITRPQPNNSVVDVNASQGPSALRTDDEREAAREDGWMEFVRPVPGQKLYECIVCKVTKECQHWLRPHIEAEHMKISYQCPYCPREVKYRPHLKSHIRKMHKDKVF